MVIREDGRSRRYLAWQAIWAWNSGRRASWSKSKYTTRWRRQASVSRSSGPNTPVVGAGSVVVGGGAAGGGGASSCTCRAQPTKTTHSAAAMRIRVVVFISSILLIELVVQVDGNDVETASALFPERSPGRLPHVTIGKHQALAYAAIGRNGIQHPPPSLSRRVQDHAGVRCKAR